MTKEKKPPTYWIVKLNRELATVPKVIFCSEAGERQKAYLTEELILAGEIEDEDQDHILGFEEIDEKEYIELIK